MSWLVRPLLSKASLSNLWIRTSTPRQSTHLLLSPLNRVTWVTWQVLNPGMNILMIKVRKYLVLLVGLPVLMTSLQVSVF